MNKHTQTAVEEKTMSQPPVFCPKPLECDLLAMEMRARDVYKRRWQDAAAVIDVLGERLGTATRFLYALGGDDRHPLIEALDRWESQSGDKVKLKKRIDELENENAVLRKLLGRP